MLCFPQQHRPTSVRPRGHCLEIVSLKISPFLFLTCPDPSTLLSSSSTHNQSPKTCCSRLGRVGQPRQLPRQRRRGPPAPMSLARRSDLVSTPASANSRHDGYARAMGIVSRRGAGMCGIYVKYLAITIFRLPFLRTLNLASNISQYSLIKFLILQTSHTLLHVVINRFQCELCTMIRV